MDTALDLFRRLTGWRRIGPPINFIAGAGLLLGAAALPLTAAPVSAQSCQAAGGTGLTAAMTVASGATIANQAVDATGCDVGIFMGPGTTGVTINNVTVTGANDHGIFAEDSSDITIEDSTVSGNGVKPTPGIFDNKAIEFVGVTDSSITGSTVTYNTADGGIGIQDNGPLDSGAPLPGPSTPVPASNIVVSSNNVSHNTGGCGIVVAAHNPGGGVSDITLKANTIVSTPYKFGPTGPEIGGIVVDAPIPHTSVSGVAVEGNTITGSLIAGIAVYAGAGPGASMSSVSLTGNTLSGDGWGEAAAGRPQPEAIMVAAYPAPPGTPPATTTGTVITGNTITREYYGEWLAYTTGTTTGPNDITTFPGGVAVYNVPLPGHGYWLAGSNGSVYALGDASSYGSLAAYRLGSAQFPAPIVGIAHTIDQGGYWLVGSNGSIYTFGDARYFGSLGGYRMGSPQVPAPIAGIAATPFYASSPGALPSPGGEGYWLVGTNGSVYTFGDAEYFGSLGGYRMGSPQLPTPIAGIAPTPDGKGYWLVGTNGAAHAFGDAVALGSLGGARLPAAISAAAAVGAIPAE